MSAWGNFWDGVADVGVPLIGAGAGFVLSGGNPYGALAGAGMGMGLRDMANQRDKLQYDQFLQNQIFNREDTSIQRRVEDLRKAGMSPVLAAGQGAGTGGIVSTEAPQWGKTKMTENALAVYQMQKMDQDIAQSNANISAINLQNQRTAQEIENNPVVLQNMKAQTAKMATEAGKTKIESDMKAIDLEIQRRYGGASQVDSGTGFIRNISDIVDRVTGKTMKDFSNGQNDQIKKQKELLDLKFNNLNKKKRGVK